VQKVGLARHRLGPEAGAVEAVEEQQPQIGALRDLGEETLDVGAEGRIADGDARPQRLDGDDQPVVRAEGLADLPVDGEDRALPGQELQIVDPDPQVAERPGQKPGSQGASEQAGGQERPVEREPRAQK
jgi:hypothetical protein